ncbi:hypothetical protein [Streptomyces botrytidirepellens]|nr:hypothetical protein [Streptomyces botrytidirepellens]
MSKSDISLATAVHRLVQWVGDGRALTSTGKLRVSDGQYLVSLLDTGDHPQGGAGLRRLSSTDNLPTLRYLLELTIEAGLLRIQRGRLLQVKKHAQQAATAEGVRQLLVENVHRTAPETLAPVFDRPDLGNAALKALWGELSEAEEAPLAISELAEVLWNAVAADPDVIELWPVGKQDEAKAHFAELTASVLLEYAQLGALATNSELTIVQLTAGGAREVERLGATGVPVPR